MHARCACETQAVQWCNRILDAPAANAEAVAAVVKVMTSFPSDVDVQVAGLAALQKLISAKALRNIATDGPAKALRVILAALDAHSSCAE
jgi:hypothetical protein